MTTLPNRRIALQPFDAALADAWALEPPDACVPLAEWVDGQAVLYRSPAVADDAPLSIDERAVEIVGRTLAALADAIRLHGCATPAEFAAFGPIRVPGGDLEFVQLGGPRLHALSDALDAHASRYLAMGTDAGRLVAAAILGAVDYLEKD